MLGIVRSNDPIRLLSERNYVRYMRGLGVAFMILGIGLLIAVGMDEFLS